jgi:hypothetical protein
MEQTISLKQLSLSQRLAGMINEYSLENSSDTPDFVLAEYMLNCLTAFNLATHRREQFYGRECGGSIKNSEPEKEQQL